VRGNSPPLPSSPCRSALPNVFEIVANLFKVVELQEPTYQEVRSAEPS
jgi:hypothetical protein